MWPRKVYVGRNRRGDFRSICTGATVMDVLSPQPRSSVQVRVLDVSRSGLMLSIPFPLAPGSFIRIKMTSAVADAKVKHCTCEGSEYHVGVEVEKIVPKDR